MIRQHPLSQDQLTKILAAAKQESTRDFCMLQIAANHAIRCSELRALKTADISLADRTIRIRRLKNSNSTTEELFDWEIGPISAWLAEKPAHELLFPSPRGGAFSRTAIYNVFRHYAELTSTPTVSRAPHAFRHTLGQTLANGGVEIKKLQLIMGHKNINSTAQYFSFTQREVDAAKRQIFLARGAA